MTTNEPACACCRSQEAFDVAFQAFSDGFTTGYGESIPIQKTDLEEGMKMVREFLSHLKFCPRHIRIFEGMARSVMLSYVKEGLS